MSTRNERGFTLIEMLLSIVLLALLLAGAYSGISAAARAMQSGENAIDRSNRLRMAQEFLRHQISRVMPLSFAQDESSGTNFVFQGDRDFMRFVAPMPGYLTRGGPYVQTLELARAGNGLQLVFTDVMLNGFDLDKLQSSDFEPVVLLNQIRDGRFLYRTLDDQGQLGDWTDKWEDSSLTPLMVRIDLTMQSGAQFVWPTMDVPLVLDVGATRQSFVAPVVRGAVK